MRVKIKKKTVLYGIVAFIVFLVLINTIGFLGGSNELDTFAQCLTKSGAKMFGAYWCPHCLNQKKMFGDSWKYVNYVECSLPNKGGQTQECKDENINGYPTWEFADGSRLSGEVALSVLAQKSGCNINN